MKISILKIGFENVSIYQRTNIPLYSVCCSTYHLQQNMEGIEIKRCVGKECLTVRQATELR